MIYVGLDVSLNSVAICVIDASGKLVQEGTTSADAPSIARYLEPLSGRVERVGLEAGPTSEWMTANLIQLGLPAISLESRQVKAALSAMPVKTDRNDARGIAQVVRTGWFKQVHVKSVCSQQARTLAAARKHVVRSLAAAEQVIRGAAAASWAQSRRCDADPVRSAGSGIGSLRRHAGGHHGSTSCSPRGTDAGIYSPASSRSTDSARRSGLSASDDDAWNRPRLGADLSRNDR